MPENEEEKQETPDNKKKKPVKIKPQGPTNFRRIITISPCLIPEKKAKRLVSLDLPKPEDLVEEAEAE